MMIFYTPWATTMLTQNYINNCRDAPEAQAPGPFLKMLALLLLFGLGSLSAAVAQGQVLDYAQTALRAGSARELTRHFQESVELSFEGRKTVYSRTQAEFVLRDFFQKHEPTNFQYVHQGASREGLQYAIGRYDTSEGNFRVYLLMRQHNGAYRIETLDFTRE